LAGSGVSYQWSAHREPADLDCLIGVNFVIFRQSNDRFVGLSNNEIADMLNEGFREHLHPKTENYLGTYELTFYVNPASDIRAIKPYAAYSLTNDSWTVMASPEEQTFPNDWFETADRDVRMAEDIITRYQAALNDMSMAQSEVVKANARTGLLLALRQGAALFDDIHTGRRQAFGPMGSGYGDYTNFRWQRGKATGAVHALKQLHKFNQSMNREVERELYGSELPGTSTLIRRAASQYRK
jgi:hypothetical protein